MLRPGATVPVCLALVTLLPWTELVPWPTTLPHATTLLAVSLPGYKSALAGGQLVVCRNWLTAAPRHGIGLLVRTAAASGVSCRLWSATHRHSSIVRIVCTMPTLFFSVRYAYFLPYVTYVKPTLYCSTKQFKLQPDTVVGTARMRSRVYETVRCPSVRPSVCPIMGPQPQTRWCRLVCCCGPDGQEMSIDAYRMLSLLVI